MNNNGVIQKDGYMNTNNIIYGAKNQNKLFPLNCVRIGYLHTSGCWIVIHINSICEWDCWFVFLFLLAACFTCEPCFGRLNSSVCFPKLDI